MFIDSGQFPCIPNADPDPGELISAVLCSVADADTGSGAFLTPDPGSGIGFFRIPDLGSRNPNIGIVLKAYNKFLGKKFYNSL